MHEICHAACDIVFTNNSLPYGADDYASKKIFHDIFVYFQKNYNNKDIPDVIKDVFEAYKGEEIQKAELIVRIPQLFTRHGYDEAMSKLELIPDGMGLELLKFYEEYFLKKVTDKFELMKKEELKKYLPQNVNAQEMYYADSIIAERSTNVDTCCTIS